MNARKDRIFQMRVDEKFLQRLDDFRRATPDLPTRTEMARRLIEMAFDLAEKHQDSIAAPALRELHGLMSARRGASSSEADIGSSAGPRLAKEKRIRGRP
jgi:hypothetical protein